mgnify:CR=1 FL=1
MILNVKKFLIYINFIFLLLLPGCYKDQNFSKYAKKPIYENPEGEFEGFWFDYILDKMIYYSFSLPKDARLKHDKAIFASIVDPNLGKKYLWQSGKYYGLVRVVKIVSNENYICKTIIQEIGIKNYKNKVKDDKICLDYQTGKWSFIDDYFYYKYF